MNFRSIFPLVDMKDETNFEFTFEFNFDQCRTNEDFISEIVKIYFLTKDLRVKESSLAVYMAYRDHYPKYLSILTEDNIKQLNFDLQSASGKIIKLRRIALSGLSKVA